MRVWAVLLGIGMFAGGCSTADDAIVIGSDNESARGQQEPAEGSGHSNSGGGGEGPGATCGDGVIGGAEQCDGASLGGATCTSLGELDGMLMCDTATCTYDTSMCGAAPMMTGGTGG